jgi:hypothetical protein
MYERGRPGAVWLRLGRAGDIETALDAKEELGDFADWCKREFCRTELKAVHQPVPAMPGVVLPPYATHV